MSLVLDSSMTLAWLFKEERTEAADKLLDQVGVAGAIVPSLWKLEVANGLQIGVRRQRLTREARNQSLADLAKLPIEIDIETDARAWSSTLQLAEHHSLTVYDAAYLELADRRGLPLASLDRALCTAGAAMGIAIL